jgi:hypothetical protein
VARVTLPVIATSTENAIARVRDVVERVQTTLDFMKSPTVPPKLTASPTSEAPAR